MYLYSVNPTPQSWAVVTLKLAGGGEEGMFRALLRSVTHWLHYFTLFK